VILLLAPSSSSFFEIFLPALCIAQLLPDFFVVPWYHAHRFGPPEIFPRSGAVKLKKIPSPLGSLVPPRDFIFFGPVFSPRARPSDFATAGPRFSSKCKGAGLRLGFIFTPFSFGLPDSFCCFLREALSFSFLSSVCCHRVLVWPHVFDLISIFLI
jgi:hypothetical protein